MPVVFNRDCSQTKYRILIMKKYSVLAGVLETCELALWQTETIYNTLNQAMSAGQKLMKKYKKEYDPQFAIEGVVGQDMEKRKKCGCLICIRGKSWVDKTKEQMENENFNFIIFNDTHVDYNFCAYGIVSRGYMEAFHRAHTTNSFPMSLGGICPPNSLILVYHCGEDKEEFPKAGYF